MSTTIPQHIKDAGSALKRRFQSEATRLFNRRGYDESFEVEVNVNVRLRQPQPFTEAGVVRVHGHRRAKTILAREMTAGYAHRPSREAQMAARAVLVLERYLRRRGERMTLEEFHANTTVGDFMVTAGSKKPHLRIVNEALNRLGWPSIKSGKSDLPAPD